MSPWWGYSYSVNAVLVMDLGILNTSTAYGGGSTN